jgi:hypothetical protein
LFQLFKDSESSLPNEKQNSQRISGSPKNPQEGEPQRKLFSHGRKKNADRLTHRYLRDIYGLTCVAEREVPKQLTYLTEICGLY